MAHKNVTPLKAPAFFEGGDFELIPAGVYLARCYRMVDIGTQQVTYTPPGGKPVTKATPQVILYWELLADQSGKPVFMGDGERVFSISKRYTFSMHKKANLRADLDAWRGEPFTDAEAKEFDITSLLDKYCMLQVIHNQGKGNNSDKTYANVGTIMSAPQEQKLKENDISSFSAASPNMELFETFPDWLKDKIREAEEWHVDDGEQNGHITPEGKVEIEDAGEVEGIGSIKRTPF